MTDKTKSSSSSSKIQIPEDLFLDDSKFTFNGPLTRAAWTKYLPTWRSYIRKKGASHIIDLIDLSLHSIIAMRTRQTLQQMEAMSSDDLVTAVSTSLLPKDKHEVTLSLQQCRMRAPDELAYMHYVSAFEMILTGLTKELMPPDKLICRIFLAGIHDNAVKAFVLEFGEMPFVDLKSLCFDTVEKFQAARKLIGGSSSGQVKTDYARQPESNKTTTLPSGSAKVCMHHPNATTHSTQECRITKSSVLSSPSPSSGSGGFGSTPAGSRSTTPQSTVKCNLCGKSGHSESHCFKRSSTPTTPPPPSKVVVIVEKCQDTAEFPTTIVSNTLPVKVSEESRTIDALLDLGADICAIHPQLITELGLSVSDCIRTVATASGEVQVTSYVELSVSCKPADKPVVFESTFFVIPDLPYDMVLSREILTSTGLLHWLGNQCPPLPDDMEETEIDTKSRPAFVHRELESIIAKHTQLFSEELPVGGALLEPLELILKPGSQPIVIPPRPQSPARRKALRELTAKYLASGALKPSRSPYSAPVHLVKKSNGPPPIYRMTVDFATGLNDQLIAVQYPLPNNKALISRLKGPSGRMYSQVDITDFFSQIPLHPNSQYLTAHSTEDGQFESTVVTQGLKPAPSWAQLQISIVLEPMSEYTVVFIDDVVIFADTMQELIVRTDNVLTALEEVKLRLKASKCRFGVEELEYLGFLINPRGYTLSDSRRSAISSIQIPATPKRLHSFLGLANFFRDFVPHYALLAGTLFPWVKLKTLPPPTDQNWDNFIKLRDSIAVAPLLHHLEYTRRVVVRTDASNEGIGAVLMNENEEGTECVVAFISHAFNNTERRWATIEMEAYAVFFALKKWESFLLGHPFYIETDHRNLVFLYRSINAKVRRWREYINLFDVTIQHIPGITNVVADAISRVCVLIHSDPVDPMQRTQVLMKVHNQLVGHLGNAATLQRVKDLGYQWPNMEDSVKSFLSSCPLCQKGTSVGINNASHGAPYSLVNSYSAFESISIDTQEYPPDDLGMKYVIAIQCLFTRYIGLFRSTTRNAMDAASALLSWVAIFGSPRILSSDNGGQFVNEVISNFLRLMGTHAKLSLAYHHQEQGHIERSFREVLRHLSNIVYSARVRSTWSDYLPLVQRILNSTVSSATNQTPNDMVFGFNVGNRFLITSGDSQTQPSSSTSSEYIQQLNLRLTEIQQDSAKHLHQLSEAKLRRRKGEETAFAIGQYVLLSHPDGKRDNKLTPKLQGPFIIERKLPLSKWEIRNLIYDSTQEVHVSRLLPYDDTRTPSALEIASLDIDEYVIEKIIDHMPKPLPRSLKLRKYLVQFTGYDPSTAEWVNYMDVRDTVALAAYMAQINQ